MDLRFFALLLISCTTSNLWSQTVEINGEIKAEKDLENIHIINKTSNRFTTTNALGLFVISAKYQDTIMVTSVQYKTVEVVVTYKNIRDKSITVFLEEQVNVLDEVIVGKVLTGDLDSDLKNSDAKAPINFYDLGLPGYTGKPLTQSERRLADADGGNLLTPTSINVYKLLNKISGRTKMLKERVFLERKGTLISAINARLNDDFFSVYPIEEYYKEEFWQFCSEDTFFEDRCKGKSDIEIFDFLIEKHAEFMDNLKERKD